MDFLLFLLPVLTLYQLYVQLAYDTTNVVLVWLQVI